MLKSLLGIAPKAEPDGSFSPSKVALMLSTSDTTDYTPVTHEARPGARSKVIVVFTERKNMMMQNGVEFSTGNHPVEALVPMLHLKSAGYEFEIATPTGEPVVFEMWAMPRKDTAVMGLYEALQEQLEHPSSLQDVLDRFPAEVDGLAAVFVPGGHGAMLGLPDDPRVGTLLRAAHDHDLFTITLCHGPGSLLATTLDGQDFLYAGYEMTVFPDSVDKQTPMVGYLPGPMPWQLCDRLTELGARIVNKKADDSCHIDRKLITGASPNAANNLGKLSAKTLLEHSQAAG